MNLLNDPWQRSSLEGDPSVPFSAKRMFHSPLKLRFASVRIRKVLHEILSSLLVALLRDDNMFLVVIRAGCGVYACNFLDPLRLGRCALDTCTTP